MYNIKIILCDLIALPSVNPAMTTPSDPNSCENRVVDYLEAIFRDAKIDTRRQQVMPGRDNLFARVEGKQQAAVILEAHTDTVSVAGMSEPFLPQQKDGRILGRGACDDKASLAAMTAAIIQAAQDGTPEHTLLFAATCDEEYTFLGIHAFGQQPEAAGLSLELLPHCIACVGEPTELDVVIAHKGAWRWRLTFQGLAAHSSDPDKGINAIYTAAQAVLRLQGYHAELITRPAHPLLGTPTASVGVIHGGTAPNIVPDSCELIIDRRMLPGEEPAVIDAELRELFSDLDNWTLDTILADHALETAVEEPVVTRAIEAAQAVHPEARIRGVQFGTNASKLDALGIRSVVCGPGSITQAHTQNEWVELAQVESAAEIYRRFLQG